MDLLIYKKCSKCKIIKTSLEFNKNKNKSLGLDCRCRQCRKQYRLDNLDNIKKKLKIYWKTNKYIIKQKRAKKIKEYYRKNREKILKKSKLYYLNNTDKIISRCKKYVKQNKEKR